MRPCVVVTVAALAGALWWRRREARRKAEAELWSPATDRRP